MQASEFAEYHRPALEANEVRHNVILALMDQLTVGGELRHWTLGAPGQCAMQSPGWPIVLGEPEEAQCHVLAEAADLIDYPGVVGPDMTARWFAERATALGVRFLEPIPQQIHALAEAPNYPGAAGAARIVGNEDSSLFPDWLIAFKREATPHDPPPDREEAARAAGSGPFMFWVVNGEPVSMAGIVRNTRHSAVIAGVYTPPPLRGRGYAGSVTAAVAEHAFAQGKTSVCLYTDLRNPSSNRCYAKIGFKPVCPSRHYPRQSSATLAR